MRRLDRALVVTALFAILLTAATGLLHRLAADGCVQVVVASSLEKAGLLNQASKDFARPSPTVGGACIQVSVEAVASGAAEEALVGDWAGRPEPRPDVWAPAATTWLLLLDQHRADLSRPALLEAGPRSLFQSPLVVAMPEPMAVALGWPDRPLGWSEIFQLAQDPKGWARYGHPEWGAFRLGKTNPNLSTSGLHALIGTYFAASGKTSDLTQGDLNQPSVTSFVRAVESSVDHYGG